MTARHLVFGVLLLVLVVPASAANTKVFPNGKAYVDVVALMKLLGGKCTYDAANSPYVAEKGWVDDSDVERPFVAISLKPSQTVACRAVVRVPSKGPIAKLMIQPRNGNDGPVLRYMLTDQIRALDPPLADTNLRYDFFRPTLTDADGLEIKCGGLVAASSGRDVGQMLKGGAELRVRLFFAVPKDTVPRALVLKEGEHSRSYQWEAK